MGKNNICGGVDMDYISREAAIEAIENTDWYHINHSGELVHGANSNDDTPLYKADDVYKAIDAVPAADVVERKTGTWEQDNPFTKPRCSECGEPCFGLHGFDYTLTPYCPNCGSRMER